MVGIKHSLFMITPVSDFTGALRFITVIFATEKLKAHWGLGVDVFAEFDGHDFAENFGPGKRCPGLHLHGEYGIEIPVPFAASPKAPTTSRILMETFRRMDELGISERGVDENGKDF